MISNLERDNIIVLLLCGLHTPSYVLLPILINGVLEIRGDYVTSRVISNAPVIVMPHLLYPNSGQVGDFVGGLISRIVPRFGDLYHAYWYCVSVTLLI